MSLKKAFVFTGAALATLATSSLAFAQAAAEEAGKVGGTAFDAKGFAALGAGIAIAAAALGGTTAQGRATTAALEGIARNPGAAPRIQTPMILGLALIESLVLLGFVIAFLLQGYAKL